MNRSIAFGESMYIFKMRQHTDELIHLNIRIGAASPSVSIPISAYTATPKVNILTVTVRSYFTSNDILMGQTLTSRLTMTIALIPR